MQFSPEGEQAILDFTYKGKSLSYSYNYLWSPLAEFLVHYVPPTWAPNSITVAGFLINAVGTIAIWMQDTHLNPVVPWTLLLYSLCVFVYQTLDNIDGKQARKLGNSTPLGMIMDHGCDALGLIFLSLGVKSVVSLNQSILYIWLYLVGVYFSFYFSVWCQYYSEGVMILGPINSVDDGIPVVWILGILTYFLGQSFWTQTIQIGPLAFQANLGMEIFVLCSGIVQIWSLKNEVGARFTKNINQALKDLIHLVCIAATVYCITFHSTLWITHFSAIIFTIGFFMARNVSYMLICTVSLSRYNQWQTPVILFCLAYPLHIFILHAYIPQSLVVYGVLLYVVGDYFYFTTSVSIRIANILNIRIFKVNKPKAK